jgi:hypothetical protein
VVAVSLPTQFPDWNIVQDTELSNYVGFIILVICFPEIWHNKPL